MKKTFCLFGNIEGTLRAWKYENSQKVNEISIKIKNNEQLIDGLEYVLDYYEGDVWFRLDQTNRSDETIHKIQYYITKNSDNPREYAKTMLFLAKPFVYLDSETMIKATFDFNKNGKDVKFMYKDVPISYVKYLSEEGLEKTNTFFGFNYKPEKKLKSGAIVSLENGFYNFTQTSMKQLLKVIEPLVSC